MARKKVQKPKPVAVITRVVLIDCEDCGEAEVIGCDVDNINGMEWISLCFDCLRARLEECVEEPDADGKWHRVDLRVDDSA